MCPQPAPAAPIAFALAKAVFRRSRNSRERDPLSENLLLERVILPACVGGCSPCARSATVVRIEGLLSYTYFEKEKNVLVVADRREQPVQTSYRALLLLLTERPPRDIPVFGQGKSLIEKQDSVWALDKSVIALANPLASTPRKSFRGVKYLQGPPNSGSAFPIRFICTKEDPGYHSVRHFRHGKLWPIAKRPSSVGQGTSKYVDVGIPSVASIGLKLWDPRWTLLGSEGFFCGEFYFTKLHAENQIDESLRE
ncbi:hypothetical protein DFH06DRAFT_1328438 [Mycena polygramma]|nr:hypothetical protein DFH06DRAFT_1328438 [Mycena polygramma]